MKLFQVKLFKNALWAVVAALLALPVVAAVLPVPATSFNHQISFWVSPVHGQLQGTVDLPSVWTVRDPQELDLFRAQNFRLDIELTNASLFHEFGPITIEVLDSAGAVLDSMSFIHVIDDSEVPFRLRIHPDDLSEATDFVNDQSTDPSAVQVILTPQMFPDMIDTNQEVRIQSDWRWNNTLVASDDAKLAVFL